jgi:hypothetical protein
VRVLDSQLYEDKLLFPKTSQSQKQCRTPKLATTGAKRSPELPFLTKMRVQLIMSGKPGETASRSGAEFYCARNRPEPFIGFSNAKVNGGTCDIFANGPLSLCYRCRRNVPTVYLESPRSHTRRYLLTSSSLPIMMAKIPNGLVAQDVLPDENFFESGHPWTIWRLRIYFIR